MILETLLIPLLSLTWPQNPLLVSVSPFLITSRLPSLRTAMQPSQPLPVPLFLLQVYGSMYHINHGNPFNMEVLVESWPEYHTVIVRPQKQEMTDNKDPYTNTYCIFSKEPKKLMGVLKNPEIINWKQMFQIQGCQESLGEGITAVAFSKSVKVNYLNLLLYVTDDILKPSTSNRSKPDSRCETEHPDDQSQSEDPNFKFSQLHISHAGLVNDNWHAGRNERSLHYIQRCIQTLPAYSLQGPEGDPVTWVVMDSTCEVGKAYTLERYRSQGKLRQLMVYYLKYLRQKNIPFYLSVLKENEKSSRSVLRSGFFVVPCGWH
ncbi:glycine N-acyltransferase-like protein 1 isoform X2 [Lepus europaeus]|uniref:glycine N-acyltransferase-like protein 1 isoform X2 n=1 Tax=Lepus europaeus TaxID=9983 RepID=UPI002B4716F1|nr:glycine N-acyltransferase-like protein 1 isoform X2 [Lepus europaeus]